MIEDYDNEDYDYFKEWDIEEYKKEIERLNNIINELEKYAQDLLENGTWSKCGAHKILDKLQELKGSESNE